MKSCPICSELLGKHNKDDCHDCMKKAMVARFQFGMRELKQRLAEILEEEKEEE